MFGAARRAHSPLQMRPKEVGDAMCPQVWRIRVAKDYRITYTVNDDRLVVLVVDAGHRRGIYR